jgi:hypothetical protein
MPEPYILIPFVLVKGAYVCPISRKRFEFRGLHQKREARKAQQEFTSDLIIELDGPNATGIRRPIQQYVKEYNRRAARTASQTGSPAVSAA